MPDETPFPPARPFRIDILQGLQQNIPLAPYTTFGIGGPARWFFSAHTEEEIAAAVSWATERQIPLFVLGGGSNVLVSDHGFAGLVLQMALSGIEQNREEDRTVFSVAAGEDWDAFVSLAVAEDCGGIECLAGIPGTVGGTPVQNVGAYGQEVSQTVAGVRCFDRTEQCFVHFSKEQCGFAYRQSRFNQAPDSGRFIVTRVDFVLARGAVPQVEYVDLRNHFAQQVAPTLAAVATAVREIRARKGMVVPCAPLGLRDPDTRSAGSFFKNPVVAESTYQVICERFPKERVPSYPASVAGDGSMQRKLPAAWLLERAGFTKGFRLGGVALSSRHTLALTNHSGTASASEILTLRDTLIAGVEAHFGVRLEVEPVFVG